MKKLILALTVAALAGVQAQADVTSQGTHGMSATMATGVIPIVVLGPQVSSADAWKNLQPPKKIEKIHHGLGSLLFDLRRCAR